MEQSCIQPRRGAIAAGAAWLVVVFPLLLRGPATAANLLAVTSDNGLPAHSVQWTDAAGLPRTAVMVDQRPQGAGYLRQLTYRVAGVDRLCRGTGDNGHFGDGYVQNHTAAGGDDSSHFTAGTTTVALAGTHHVILSYDMPGYQITRQTVPTTVQWFFAEGRSHPIFALSQDARATAGNLGADSRSPYGDVAYDGGAGATAGGASFGDTYKFATLAANPEQVTRASGWRYDEANTIPYAMQWTDPAQVDAEMGHVATLPISVQDQGSDPRTFPTVDVRATQQPDGPMIDDENWAFQILNYVLPANGPTGSKRLTWGSNWGRPGGFDNWGDAALNPRQYSQHATSTLGHAYNGNRADGMLLSYSVFVVLGTHTGGYKGGTVGQVVQQMENAAQATLAAAVGTVKASGPAGVGNAAAVTVAYTPAGYNPVYSSWELVASANGVDATLTPAAGKPLDHPLLVVNGYTAGQLPASISVGAGLATPDVDYLATLDTANQRLWITVNRTVSAAMNLKVAAPGAAQPPIITAIPASGTVGTSIIITGNNFGGATAVTFHGTAASFTVDSATQITAVVPGGATAGPISVTTPAGSATSAASFTPLPAAPAANLIIYADQLQPNFEDWSWATVDWANPAPVHSGADSIKVTAAAWQGFYIHFANPLPTALYASLSYWINGGVAGGQPLQLQATVNGNEQTAVDLGPVVANSWQQHTVPLTDLGLGGQASFDGFWIKNASDQVLSPFYLDDIELVVAPPPVVNLHVNANQVVRSADARWFGVNTAVWDNNLNTPETVALLQEMGCQLLRYPGGAQADMYDWSASPADTTAFAGVAAGAGAQGMITVNYGSGTAAEAANWVHFCNVEHAFGFKYWEIGNENYGFWETDNTARPHDPYTYAVRAADYIQQMKAVDPTIKIGVPALVGEDSPAWNAYQDHPALNPFTGQTHYGWSPVMLATFKALGVAPDFLVFHLYPEDTQNAAASPDNDASLLQSASAWPSYASDLRQQISAYFGAGGDTIQLLCTENNSDSGLQGRQSTSLVNGLYYADSLSQMMLTEFNAYLWWDLRNGTDTQGSFSPTLYGWRDYGDFGLVNGLTTRHPTFYAAKLMHEFARPKDAILGVSSDHLLLSAYAARHADGTLSLLVINKDLNLNTINAQMALDGFAPQAIAAVRSYGIPQDNAARDNGSAQAQDIATASFGTAAANFSYAFPPLSLTLLTLTPVAPPPSGPRLTLSLEAISAGLQIVSGPGLYDRQNIATDTTTNDYGWIGANAPQVTYALTIAEFPPEAYRGFQAHVFLVPNSSGSAAPDYDDPSVVMLDIQARADGTASAWLRYKVNQPADNSFLYGAGTLGRVDCATGPLGTWTLSFPANASATLTAPDGSTTQLNFPDPAAIQPAFGGKVTAYFGNQPNDDSQIGKATLFSRIRITGTPRAQPVDETFPGPGLNQHPAPVNWLWTSPAAAPSGVSVLLLPGLTLRWTLPDTGFVLQFSPGVSPAAWGGLTLPGITADGSTKVVHVPLASLPNSGRGFFRLLQGP